MRHMVARDRVLLNAVGPYPMDRQRPPRPKAKHPIQAAIIQMPEPSACHKAANKMHVTPVIKIAPVLAITLHPLNLPQA